MAILIEKRDGRLVVFSKDKIVNAMSKAFFSTRKEFDSNFSDLSDSVACYIERKALENNSKLNVEDIQDIIEHKLMCSQYKDVAKSYIKYRDHRSIERGRRSELVKNISEKIRAKNVQNQNANMDEKSFGGRMGEARNELMKDYALKYCMSEMSRNNHLENIIYIHDLDSYAVGMHNCMSMPLDDLLKNGFITRQTDVRPAQSLNTAMQLVAVLFQLQSLQQFGGVSATHLDWTMVPYVRKSFTKHLADGMKYVEGKSDYKIERFWKWLKYDENHKDNSIHMNDEEFKSLHESAWNYAMDMTEREAYQAVEGLYHNLNTLQSRSGNQLPFTSINYGTCTLPEGRLITKVLLNVSIDGIGKLHRTPIFPCGIFQYMKGVNDKEGTPNYDLYRLALKSTAKRLYPNYANVDWSGNVGYDINNPSTYFSTMGALAGHEHLYIRINDGDPIDISIKDFYELCNGNSLIKGRPMQLYYNKPEMNVPTDYNWRRNQNRSVANDIKECSGVYKVTYIPEDISYIGSSSNIQQRVREHKKCIRHKGGIDAGLNFEDTNVDNYKFEVLEYVSDYRQAEKKYINIIPNANFRGTSSKYYKNVGITRGRGFDTRPSIPMNPDIPQDFIDLNELNIKVLDKGNTWVKVKHVFKNSEFNTPLMMHITYVENGKTYSLCCTEDHPLWTGTKFTKACELTLNDVLFRGDGLQLPIKEIKYHYDRRESYDIGTETGTFIGSDILMHNCRTANGVDINQTDPKLKQLKDGRGNLCPVTVILPKIAMMAKERAEEIHKDIVDVFFEILENKIEEAKDMLIERYHWLCMQSPDSARFMYENHVMYGYKEDEGIESALKHGTLSLGQLGLAETLQILVGCNHTKPEGMKLAKKIEGLFAKKCKEYKEGYKLNFGVYYTPAENLCYTAMKKFKDEYGIIPNVSDKDYFTNSMHVPVWEKLSPFDKIDVESQLTGFSSAGCITYVELDGSVNRNIDALEQIVNYAMDKDIPYFAVNVPSDLCLDCGYQGEINNECPQCHSKNIQQLRRVTGYLTGNYLTAFNKGKQEEVHDRVKHANKLVDFEGKELEEKVNF